MSKISGVAPCSDHRWHRKVAGCLNHEMRRPRSRRTAGVGWRGPSLAAFSGSRVMKARELLEAGKLTAAIEALNGELKAKPNDLPGRTILFELLCYAGDLARAERQLDVIGHQGGGAEAAIGVRFYQNLLAAEKARTRLFSEGVRPGSCWSPPPRSRSIWRRWIGSARADRAKRGPCWTGRPRRGPRSGVSWGGTTSTNSATPTTCWPPSSRSSRRPDISGSPGNRSNSWRSPRPGPCATSSGRRRISPRSTGRWAR